MEPNKTLTFSKGNAKLKHAGLYTMSLVAGHSCPFARDCLSKVNLTTKKIEDGKHTQFRCFSASTEALFPNVFKSRLDNFNLLKEAKTAEAMYNLIHESIPAAAKIVRIHVSGDFFSQNYFDAWMQIALTYPSITFYAYTKALPFWVNRLLILPDNFILTASRGGTKDELIDKHGLRSAEVVFHPEEDEAKGLEIDHDDSHAMSHGPSFALLLHGVQPAKSKASKALTRMMLEEISFSYRR